jgi:hypothetical protein
MFVCVCACACVCFVCVCVRACVCACMCVCARYLSQDSHCVVLERSSYADWVATTQPGNPDTPRLRSTCVYEVCVYLCVCLCVLVFMVASMCTRFTCVCMCECMLVCKEQPWLWCVVCMVLNIQGVAVVWFVRVWQSLCEYLCLCLCREGGGSLSLLKFCSLI